MTRHQPIRHDGLRAHIARKRRLGASGVAVFPAIDLGRVASAALIIFGVAAGLVLLMDVVFAGRIIALNAELVATGALLAAAGGLYAWLQARHRLIKLNEQADHLANMTLALEASVRKLNRTNKSLTESEARYRSLVNAQGDIILRRDVGGRLTFVNGAFCDQFGISDKDVLNTSFKPKVVKGRRQPVPVAKLEKPPHSFKYDQLVETSNGPRWISWEDRAVLSDTGKLSEVQTVGRDISDHKKTEQELAKARDLAQDANRAKSMFLATMSHEIRTPMNGVLGMAKLLTATRLTDEQQTYTAAISKSGDALMTLIDDILDFSKIEAGKLNLENNEFNLTEAVEEVTELLAPKAYAKGLDIACFVDPALSGKLIGDEARLRQILLNLAGNAIKFTAEGMVFITAEPAPGDTDKTGRTAVRFAINDTGIGMSAKDIEAVFGDFTQADSTPSRKYGGTGLGLAISRRLVEHMGSSIEVESTPDAGSRFQFTVDFKTGAPAQTDTGRHAKRREGLNVLIISSGRATGPAIANYIKRFGSNAEVCRDARHARELIARSSRHRPAYTTVICDYSEPLVSAAALSKTLGVERKSIKMLIAIWPEQRDMLQRLKRGGFDGYLVKPVRRKSLSARLEVLYGPAGGRRGARDVWAEPDKISDNRNRQKRSTRRLNILLAEDNDINALLTKSLLNNAGHKVVHVKNGLEAVDLIKRAGRAGNARAKYDLVLMDLHMPELDGLSATREIRKLERAAGLKAKNGLPIIALTANAFDEDREICLAAGMNDYLSKPVDPVRFLNVVFRWVKNKSRKSARA